MEWEKGEREMPLSDYDLGAWAPYLAPIQDLPWCTELLQRVDLAYQAADPPVFPPREDLFTALRLTSPKAVRCVILGQDPYHEMGQAHGLSFSVRPGVPVPRSLRNIYKELHADLGLTPPDHGCLEDWARQGVLLLNTVLTVYEGQANSHQRWGWERFTSHLIDVVEAQPQPVAYVLWGKSAQKKIQDNHLGEGGKPRLILTSNHPSPLSASRGFFGSRPFSKVNSFLQEHGEAPIDWSLNSTSI